MRPTPLIVVLALACGVPSAELGHEASAAPVAVGAPVAAPAADAATSGDDDDFFLGHDDREIVGWDTTARNHGVTMRLALAPIAPPTTIGPPTTVVGTTGPGTTGPGTTVAPGADADSDGYDTNVDCNDANSSIYPGAAEVIGDGVDQDCDGQELCQADADVDGYGGSITLLSVDLDCADAGESDTTDDCLDVGDLLGVLAADVHPGATEVCNGVDDDCNGTADDGLTVPSWYEDGDGDGYGAGTATVACDSPGEGFVDAGGDCADDDADLHPGATDVPGNGIDEDCTDGDATEDSGDLLDTDFSDGDSDETPGSDDDGGGDGKACGGCDTGAAASPTGLAALVGLVGLARRRRRS